MNRYRPLSLGLILVGLLATSPAQGQMFEYGSGRPGAANAILVGYHAVKFEFNGDEGPERPLDFDSPVFGIRFAQRNVDIEIAWGIQDQSFGEPDLKYLDASLFAHAPVIRLGTGGLAIPLAIHSGFRSVGENLGSDLSDTFSYTVLGMGTGIAYQGSPLSRVRVAMRATPVFGLAFRSIEGYAGTSWLIDADLIAHAIQVFGRFGLSFGYGFRVQEWNPRASRFISQLPDDYFDYMSTQHVLSVGINW